jgi:hypothetical protein
MTPAQCRKILRECNREDRRAALAGVYLYSDPSDGELYALTPTHAVRRIPFLSRHEGTAVALTPELLRQAIEALL